MLSRSWRLLGLCVALLGAAVPWGASAAPQRGGQSTTVVQVGAFRGPTSAVALAVEIEEKGFQPSVVPGDDYYRVVIGPYPDDAAANAALSKLKSLGYDGYIRRDLEIPGAPPAPRAPAQPQPPPVTPRAAPAPAEPTPPAPQPEVAPEAPTTTVEPEAPATTVEPGPPTVGPPTAVTPPAPAAPVTPAPATPPDTPPAEPETPAQPTSPAPQITTILPGVGQEPARPEPPEEPAPDQPATAAEILKQTAEPPRQVAAATPPEPGTPAIGRAPSVLKLLVLQGQDAINNIKRRTARDPVVQVTDENDRPIGGVAITFTLPSRGPSGVFANGARSLTAITNSEGIATATGFTPNTVEGDLMMQVSASYQGQTASTVIAQANIAGAGGMSAATIGIIGAVAAAAAVGAVVALGGDDSPNPGGNPQPRPSGTATINTGGITIGAPSQ